MQSPLSSPVERDQIQAIRAGVISQRKAPESDSGLKTYIKWGPQILPEISWSFSHSSALFEKSALRLSCFATVVSILWLAAQLPFHLMYPCKIARQRRST